MGRYVTTVPKAVKRALGYLGPTLEERLTQEKQHGAEWAERPVCIVHYLMDYSLILTIPLFRR